MPSFSCKPLPVEMEIKILERLPIKTLIRFSCVCKSWNSIIKDPVFVSKHLHNHSNSCNILAFSRDLAGNFSSECSIVSWTTLNEISKQKIPADLIRYQNLRAEGSCNGLICMRNYPSNHVYLWNPTIQKFMTLCTDGYYSRSKGWPVFVIGFGFHPQTNSYKVVSIMHYFLKNGVKPDVEVYVHNMRIWKRINEGITANFCRFKSPCAVVNGAIHWMASKCETLKLAILSFDIGEENFKKIKLPVSRVMGRIDSPYVVSVILFKELLGLFVCSQHGGEKLGYIWVMKEYGVVASWTELFTIELREQVCQKSTFIHDKFVLSGDGKRFVLCDLESQQFRHIEHHDSEFNIEMVTFVESMVWLERGDACEENQHHIQKNGWVRKRRRTTPRKLKPKIQI